MMLRNKINTHQIFASVLLVILCVQFVAIEGDGVSPIKVGIMALSTLCFLVKVPYISKALIFGILYWILHLLVSLLHGQMRFSTIGYLWMFVIAYITYYNLIRTDAFSLTYFIKLLRGLILAYSIILILQQVAMLVGVTNLPIINLNYNSIWAIDKLPSLAIEPSHSARILAVAMLGYLRCNELRNGVAISFSQLCSKEHRLISILFLWSMLTMGSSTAFIALGILAVYFVRKHNAIYIIPILIGLLLLAETMEVKNMQRALDVAEAFTSGDNEKVIEADGSASYRVVPILNFFKLDLSDKSTWVGHGIDYSKTIGLNNVVIGGINDYGLICFIFAIIFVYSCMIYKFFSVETLLFVFLLGMTLANGYYIWGCLMIFTTTRFFQEKSKLKCVKQRKALY